MATIRRQVRIARPAAEVWAMVGDPAALAEWFPGHRRREGRRHDAG